MKKLFLSWTLLLSLPAFGADEKPKVEDESKENLDYAAVLAETYQTAIFSLNVLKEYASQGDKPSAAALADYEKSINDPKYQLPESSQKTLKTWGLVNSFGTVDRATREALLKHRSPQKHKVVESSVAKSLKEINAKAEAGDMGYVLAAYDFTKSTKDSSYKITHKSSIEILQKHGLLDELGQVIK